MPAGSNGVAGRGFYFTVRDEGGSSKEESE